MKVAEKIRKAIALIPESQPFGYSDLGIEAGEFVAAAKALERLQKKGTIKRVSKGVFYVPRETIFGALGPDYEYILKQFLFKNGKRVGYITGGELYNGLNLTTQNYFRTTIATNRSRKKIEMGWLKTNTVKAYSDITEENYQILGILDAIKDIRNIADTSTSQAIIILSAKIAKFEKNDIQSLMKYALQYPPRVRALLGAIVEEKFRKEFDLTTLKNSLNPTSSYSLRLKVKDFPTIKNWNIK